MHSWSASDVKLALDVLDWIALFGDDPVCFERWRQRLFPDTKSRSAHRTWLRTKNRLERSRYKHHIEISVSPFATHNGLHIAILHRSKYIAASYLDRVQEDRIAHKEIMRVRRLEAERATRQRRREEADALLAAHATRVAKKSAASRAKSVAEKARRKARAATHKRRVTLSR